MSCTIQASASPVVKRSWADIVKGSDAASCSEHASGDSMFDRELEGGATGPRQSASVLPPSRKAVRPGVFGAKTCLCYGRLLVILGHYGWIEARDIIDHPDSQKNGGRIYIRRRDVVGEVQEGEIVCFYLYADERGLGAECCQAALACDLKKIVPLITDSEDFTLAVTRLQGPSRPVPAGFNVHAPAFAPRASAYSDTEVDTESDEEYAPDTTLNANMLSIFNPEAEEFAPSRLEQHASPPVRLDASCLEFGAPAAVPTQTTYGEAMCAHIANFFCDESDDDSDEDIQSPCSMGLDVARSASIFKMHVNNAPSPSSNVSTSGGDSSDSDSFDGEYTLKPFVCVRPPPGLCTPKLPPGLCLPAAFSAPPGLAMPVGGGKCAAA